MEAIDVLGDEGEVRRAFLELDEAAVAGDLTREPESVDEAIAIDQNSRLLAHQLLPEIAAKAV